MASPASREPGTMKYPHAGGLLSRTSRSSLRKSTPFAWCFGRAVVKRATTSFSMAGRASELCQLETLRSGRILWQAAAWLARPAALGPQRKIRELARDALGAVSVGSHVPGHIPLRSPKIDGHVPMDQRAAVSYAVAKYCLNPLRSGWPDMAGDGASDRTRTEGVPGDVRAKVASCSSQGPKRERPRDLTMV